MPIWFELMILLLITYAFGLALGWLMWSAAGADDKGMKS